MSGSQRQQPPWWQRLIIGRHPKWTLVRAAVWLGLGLFAAKYVVVPIRVKEISMLPAYHEGQLDLVNKWAYRWSRPRRGDVVAIRFSPAKTLLLKRIVGLPGERVEIRRGTVLINGQPLVEPYLKRPRAYWYYPDTLLAEQEYFVIGDNREMAQTNHLFGRYEFDEIVGKVMF